MFLIVKKNQKAPDRNVRPNSTLLLDNSSLSTRFISPSGAINCGFVYSNVDTLSAYGWLNRFRLWYLYTIDSNVWTTNEDYNDTKDFQVECKLIRKRNVHLMRLRAYVSQQ